MIKLGNVKILKRSTENTVDTTLNEISNQKDVRLTKLEDNYKNVQNGSMVKKDFQKTLMRTQPKLLAKLSDSTRIGLNRRLKELLNWYIDIKKILISMDSQNLDPVFKNIDTLDKRLKLFTHTERFDKEQSALVRKLISEFLNDDPIKPRYNVSNGLIGFLAKTNRNNSFIKELVLCFGIYRKYISRLAEDFSKQIEMDQDKVYFKTMDEVQPRFNMINNHIKNSIPTIGNDRDFDLKVFEDSMGEYLNIDQNVSGMGIRKRLNEINNWLNSGLIHAQYSFNRLNNLKIIRGPKNIDKNYEETIQDNYHVWALLKDIEAFLGSMEDMLSGKSYIVGLITEDNLDVLKVSY